MTKVLIHTDQHYGVRNDNPVFYDHAKRCNAKFFDYIAAHQIQHVFLLGDLFDRRKYVNMQTLYRCQQDFLDPLAQTGAQVYIITGNHDCYFKNTYTLNWAWELVKQKYPFKVFATPAPVFIDGHEIQLLPWITEDNQEASLNAAAQSRAKILMGHLELKGFSMYRGLESRDGLDSGLFSNFSLVLSGHFHTRSRRGNIVYVGAATDYNWSDFNDPRGFTCLDLDTLQLDFVDNDFTLFKVVEYQEGKKVDAKEYADCFVKVIRKGGSAAGFEALIDSLNKENPIQLSPIDETLAMTEGDSEELTTLAQQGGTREFINEFVDRIDTDLDKDKLKNLFENIHTEAVSLDL